MEIPYKVRRTEARLQDLFVHFDELTELKNSNLFELVQLPPRAYEYFEDVIMAVSLEIDPDKYVVTRKVYTVLDLLSQVGGLRVVFVGAFGALLRVINRNYQRDYLMGHLYKLKDQANHTFDPRRREAIPSRNSACSRWFFGSGGSRKRRSEQHKRAEKALYNEIDIVQILSSIRYFHRAMDSILTPAQIERYKKESSSTVVKP